MCIKNKTKRELSTTVSISLIYRLFISAASVKTAMNEPIMCRARLHKRNISGSGILYYHRISETYRLISSCLAFVFTLPFPTDLCVANYPNCLYRYNSFFFVIIRKTALPLFPPLSYPMPLRV